MLSVDWEWGYGVDVELEAAIRTIGTEIHDALPRPSRNPVKVVDARAMEMAARDEELRSALFRLVDVTPACRSTADLARHLAAYLEEVPERPPALDAALRAAHSPGGARALGRATAVGVRHMAHRFIAGETPKKALGEFQRLWEAGVASSVDLLGEATVTTAEADHYASRCRDALDTVAPAAARWPAREALERDSLGGIARANVSVKISALTPHIRPEAPQVGRDDAGARLRPLLRRAKELGAYLHIDMESVDSLETTFDLIFGVLGEDEFRDGPEAGLVLQAYLRESPQQLEQVLEFVRARRTTQLNEGRNIITICSREVAALDVLHRVVAHPALAAHRVHRHDVGVVQARRRLRLDLEPLQLPGVQRRGERQDLQRHPPAQRDLPRLVDDPHAAPADLADDPVVAQHAHPGDGVGARGRGGGRARGEGPAQVGHHGDGRQQPAQLLGPLGVLPGVRLDVHRLAGLELAVQLLDPLGQDRVAGVGLGTAGRTLGIVHRGCSSCSSPRTPRSRSSARSWRILTAPSPRPRTSATSPMGSPSR